MLPLAQLNSPADKKRESDWTVMHHLRNTNFSLPVLALITPGPAPTPDPCFLSEHDEIPLLTEAGVLNVQVDFIQFETDLTMEEVIAFYRQELGALGLVETSFGLDEIWGGTMNFDEPGKGTVLIVSYVPADKAPFHLRPIKKPH